MKYAVLVSTEEIIDAADGDYSTTNEKIATCTYCKNPVFWRSQIEYFNSKLQKKITSSACWVHFPGGDKSCPLYTSGNTSGEGSVIDCIDRGQRERILLERFAEVISWALGIPCLEFNSSQVHSNLVDKCVFPPSRFPKPLSDQGVAKAVVNSLLSILIEDIKNNQALIKQEIAINSLITQAFDFLLINKNSELLNQVILTGIKDFNGSLSELSNSEIESIKTNLKTYIIDKFRHSDFHQAYTLLKT